MSDKELFLCRVCGLEQADPPWGEDGKTASFLICHCCGTEFGYEDVKPISAKKARERWLSQGSPWFWPKDKPENWDLEEQLQQIPTAFR